MSTLLAIDPGVHKSGVAFFRGRELEWAKYFDSTAVGTLRSFSASRVVIEFPRIYRAAKQKGDQNDLLMLALTVGRFEAWLGGWPTTVDLIYPRDWKGTLDPDAMIERIQERLEPYETDHVYLPTAASLHHNVWDAVGIGLHALGRLTPKRVIHR